MEQLIFIGIIVVFSFLESIARKNRQRNRSGGHPAPSERNEWEWKGEPGSRDSGPSYGEADATTPAQTARPTPSSSEGMIPADVWEEIQGLAKGRTSAPTRTRPMPEPLRKPPEPESARRTSRPVPSRRAPAAAKARRVEEIPRRPVETHRVHLSHRDYGTDPSKRAPSEQDGLDPLAATVSGDTRSVRRQLKSHSPHALRQAVILQELLGPPAALRPDRFEE